MADPGKPSPVAHARELAMLVGTGSVAYGSWLIYEPAGFIVGGLILFVAGLIGVLRGRPGGGA